jgi:hypothetical protein
MKQLISRLRLRHTIYLFFKKENKILIELTKKIHAIMNNRSKHFQYMSTHIAAFKKKLARDKHTLILYYIIYTFTVFFVVLFFFRIFEWDHWEKRWKRVCHYYFFFLKKNKFWNMFMLFFYCKRHLFLSRNLHTHTKKQFVVRPCFLNVCSFLFVPFFSYLHENKHTHVHKSRWHTFCCFFFCISVWFICLVISWNILCGEKTKTRQNLGGIHTNKNKKKIVWTFFSLSLSTVISTILYIIYINLCV